jgi:hypothetical protein
MFCWVWLGQMQMDHLKVVGNEKAGGMGKVANYQKKNMLGTVIIDVIFSFNLAFILKILFPFQLTQDE